MHRRAEGSEGTSPKATAKRRASVCVTCVQTHPRLCHIIKC